MGTICDMPRRRFILDTPDRFVADAIGEPGRRTFYLQAVQGRAAVSVALEKVQLQLLAERLSLLLDEVQRRGLETDDGSAAERTGQTDDTGPLEHPVVPLFRVGAMVLTWHGDRQRVIVETRDERDGDADDVGDPGDDDRPDVAARAYDPEDGPDFVRVSISSDLARAFVRRAARVLAAGRPPCPICGQPLDAEGHICPRRGPHLN